MRTLRRLSQGLTPIILIALAVAIGAWGMRVSARKKETAERAQERQSIATTEARVGEFEVVVEGIGALEAVNSKPIVAEVSGQIITVVPNGVRVKEGDEIAALDAPRMARELRDQELAYQNSVENLENTKRDLAAQVKQAEIGLSQAQQQLERFQLQKDAELKDRAAQRDHDAEQLALAQERFDRRRKLADEGLIPEREIELAKAALERDKFNLERQNKDLEIETARKESEELDKQAAVTRAESELARARSAQEDEVQNADLRLQIQKRQLDRARDQLDKAVIHAPADGIVVLTETRDGMSRRPLQPGDQVWRDRPIGTIPDLDKMRVVVEVPQKQARLIKRGQPAVVRVEALAGLELEGEVTEIAQTASESEGRGGAGGFGERTFRTFAEIADTKGAPLRPGMTATVRITVEEVVDAITVPLECVFERDERRFVYVRRGDRFEEVEVELGQENVDAVVVTKGLKGGEEIALRDVGSGGEPTTAAEASPSGLPL